jgi:hypothetical protein
MASAAAAARVEDERSSSSGRALGAFSALLGAGALYTSYQRTVLPACRGFHLSHFDAFSFRERLMYFLNPELASDFIDLM